MPIKAYKKLYMKARFNEFYSIDELEELIKKSNDEPVVFFKHSITCPISKGAFRQISEADANIWVMVVQDARKAADALAAKTGIKHESPQTIILKDEKPVYHASHYDATVAEVEAVIAKYS